MGFIKRVESSSRTVLVAIALAIVAITGTVDYMIGYHLSLAIFYLLAVLLAIWFVGRGFAIFISILSVAVSLIGDVASGAIFSNSLVPWWNTVIVLAFYLAFIPLVSSLRSLQQGLEEKSAALNQEKRALRLLSGRLISAQEEERHRISRDLHDDLGQFLTSMNLDLQSALIADHSAKKNALIERALGASQEAGKRIRELSWLLRPPILDDLGLKEALETYLSEFSCRTRIEAVLKFSCSAALSGEEIVHIYRIVLEALTNISKYAKAGFVQVEMTSTDKEITVAVHDDGVGFDIGNTEIEKSLGLAGMKERAELLGGSFSLNSSPGNGTLVTVKLPISSARQ